FAILWNISIRKAVAIVVPNVEGSMMMMEYETVLGFLVCRETTDPKIVKIIQINSWSNMENISSILRQLEVFTLSTPVWRSPVSNLPRVSIRFGYLQVAIDGVLYWLATDRITIGGGGGFRLCNLIISFDMTNEEFKEINLPDTLANQPYYNLSIFKRRESLVVIERGVEEDTPVFYVWMMEDGVSKMFTKLFTIYVNTPDATINGFKRSGEPVIDLGEDLGASGIFCASICRNTASF
ncbi:F-box protein At2g18780-like, partial [Bidens hawaiensis]|uniref:F-box protein At2g18780-like n=1 Tax=Bidens hawaiensis TaxID=980011 RepID=UPI0040494172